MGDGPKLEYIEAVKRLAGPSDFQRFEKFGTLIARRGCHGHVVTHPPDYEGLFDVLVFDGPERSYVKAQVECRAYTMDVKNMTDVKQLVKVGEAQTLKDRELDLRKRYNASDVFLARPHTVSVSGLS